MSQGKRTITARLIVVVALAGLFLFFSLLYGRPVIQNDGISYYALTASLLEDGDFNLQNQYQKHREVRVIPQPERGKVASYYSCGFAFLYYPPLSVMDLFSGLRELRPYAQNVKFPFSHSAGVFAGSVFYSFFSVLLAYRVLVRYQQLSTISAFLLAIACFIGTPLMFYTFTVPSFAHAADTFLLTCAFVLAIGTNRWQYRSVRWRHVLLGFVLAFSVMLRNNNIVVLPVIALGLLYFDRHEGWRNAIRTSTEMFLGALPVILTHAYFNFSQYGALVATGYTVDVAQHAKVRLFRFSWIFFHPVAGIYSWSPLAFLGTIGLLIGALKRKREAILAIAVTLVVIISIRFAAIIFPGSTFGQRLLTHLYIFWVWGIAELILRFRVVTSVLIGGCVVWTFLLFNTYYILTGSRESKIMTRKGGSSPVEWIQTSVRAYAQAKQEGDTSNPVSYWYKNLGAKPYPTVIHILSRQDQSM